MKETFIIYIYIYKDVNIKIRCRNMGMYREVDIIPVKVKQKKKTFTQSLHICDPRWQKVQCWSFLRFWVIAFKWKKTVLPLKWYQFQNCTLKNDFVRMFQSHMAGGNHLEKMDSDVTSLFLKSYESWTRLWIFEHFFYSLNKHISL